MNVNAKLSDGMGESEEEIGEKGESKTVEVKASPLISATKVDPVSLGEEGGDPE